MAKAATLYRFSSLCEDPDPNSRGPVICAPDGTKVEFVGGRFETRDGALAKVIEASGLAVLADKAKVVDEDEEPENAEKAPEV